MADEKKTTASVRTMLCVKCGEAIPITSKEHKACGWTSRYETPKPRPGGTHVIGKAKEDKN